MSARPGYRSEGRRGASAKRWTIAFNNQVWGSLELEVI